MKRVVASIEARMCATRLPGKVLMDLAGKPALTRMLDRVRRAKRLDGIVIATSENAEDDAIARWAEDEGVSVFRGSEENVLDRVLKAQRKMDSDVVVELCGDCPLIDPEIIDLAVERFGMCDCDIVTTTEPQSYPGGLDAEVFAISSLEEVAARHNSDPLVREHVSYDFYRDRERWRLVSLRAPAPLHRPDVRLLIDWPEDVPYLSRLCEELDTRYGAEFTTADVLALVDSGPSAPSVAQAGSATIR